MAAHKARGMVVLEKQWCTSFGALLLVLLSAAYPMAPPPDLLGLPLLWFTPARAAPFEASVLGSLGSLACPPALTSRLHLYFKHLNYLY